MRVKIERLEIELPDALEKLLDWTHVKADAQAQGGNERFNTLASLLQAILPALLTRFGADVTVTTTDEEKPADDAGDPEASVTQ